MTQRNLYGRVAYLGPVQFAPGVWAGVRLFTREGLNDGTVDNVKYFHAPDKRGVFVHALSEDTPTHTYSRLLTLHS